VISHHKRLVIAFGLISSTAPATPLCLCCVFYTSTKLIVKLVIKNRETAVQGDVNCFHHFYKWCFVLAKEMVFVLAGIIGNFSSQWCPVLDQVLLLYHLSILQLSDSDYVVAVPDGKQCILQMSFQNVWSLCLLHQEERDCTYSDCKLTPSCVHLVCFIPTLRLHSMCVDANITVQRS